MLIGGMDGQLSMIREHIQNFQFSYVFVICGFDKIVHCRQNPPEVDFLDRLDKWFTENLAEIDVPRAASEKGDENFYPCILPKIVAVTIPKVLILTLIWLV